MPRHARYISQSSGFPPLSDRLTEPDISLPFPVEFLIRDTPRSHQSANTKAKEAWKK